MRKYQDNRAQRADKGKMVDHVATQLCSICGKVAYSLEADEKIEQLLNNMTQPAATTPVCQYA